jgi:hypothetical protein
VVRSARAIGSSCEMDRCRSRTLSRVVVPVPAGPRVCGAPMGFLDVGVGDGATICVDQHDLVVLGRCLQGEIGGGVQSAGL